MFGFGRAVRETDESAGTLAAISRSQAMITFTPDGVIVDANANFLAVMGYALDEVAGQHHRMFVDPAYAASPEYRTFWDALRRGEPQVAEFRRFGKGGREVWIEASYSPVLDPTGKVARIVKVATDITEKKRSPPTGRGSWRRSASRRR